MAKKSAKKLETVKFAPPFWGVARFPKLNKPDTEGEYADGKFKTDIVYEDEGELESIRDEMKAAWKKLLPDMPYDEDRTPFKNFTRKKKDGDKVEIIDDGYGIRAKSKNRPTVLDAKLQPVPASKIIGGGSVIRISGALAAYASTEKVKENGKTKSVEVQGLTLYLNGLQVKKLVSGRDVSEDFEEEEGFEYEADEVAEDVDSAADL